MTDAARGLGVEHVQWQTPCWNTDAIRFYDRVGALVQDKVRYRLTLPAPIPQVADCATPQRTL